MQTVRKLDCETYCEIVSRAMTGDRPAQNKWYAVLAKIRARRDLEAQVIRDARKKSPGLTDDEILNRYAAYLDKAAPQWWDSETRVRCGR
jgi:hypothetical protein